MCKFDGVSGCQAGQIARSIFVRAMPAESSVLLPAAKIVLIISGSSSRAAIMKSANWKGFARIKLAK